MEKRVLVVDDSQTIRRAVSMSLAGEGYQVETVASVDEAVSQIAAQVPSCIVADLSLPGKNGFDLCQMLAEQGRHVPVVILHGKNSSFDAARAATIGVSGDVKKPFDTQSLIDSVQEALSKVGQQPSIPKQPLIPNRPAVSVDSVAAVAKVPTTQPPVSPIAISKEPPQRPSSVPRVSLKAISVKRATLPHIGAASNSSIILDAFPTSGIGVQSATKDAVHAHLANDGVNSLSREVIESIAWEVVPDMVESIIREEVAKYLAARPRD